MGLARKSATNWANSAFFNSFLMVCFMRLNAMATFFEKPFMSAFEVLLMASSSFTNSRMYITG